MANQLSWDVEIARFLAGADDDLPGLVDTLLGDVDWGADGDNDADVMCEAEMRIEDVIHGLDASPLNLKRIRNWMRSRVLPAGPERLLCEDFRPLMSDPERVAILADARKNFDRAAVAMWATE